MATPHGIPSRHRSLEPHRIEELSLLVMVIVS